MGLVFAFAAQFSPSAGGWPLIVAATVGAYMAMNIGANDVANNVGPSVGSGAITLGGAILIAGIFEAAGALIAGGEVVSTIKNGIIDAGQLADPDEFVWLMMAALLAGALWLNIATAVGAPVSTTHSIVGGVLGAGLAAGGTGIADWDQVLVIVISWIISPLLGGVIAAAFLYLIKRTVTYQKTVMAAASRMVPLLLTLMAWSFSTYLVLKGLKQIWKVDFLTAILIGAVPAAITYAVTRPRILRRARELPNDKAHVNDLFTLSLIFAAALLSFAHGANDVANAVGPLAAINEAIVSHGVATKAAIPVWVMLIGALGLSVGLALYGPRLIRTVGSEITELDKTRAFCIALAAAITVILASQLGLPVSSTHIAVGGVFGVGFLREYLKTNYSRLIHEIENHHQGADRQVVEDFLKAFEGADIKEKGAMLQQLRRKMNATTLSRKERKRLKRLYKKDLVKRTLLLKVIAAWVITVPASAGLAAILFFALRGFSIGQG
ncbi:MAG TPA: inorganic phosphate transporter [Pseudomonadales bacterium]